MKFGVALSAMNAHFAWSSVSGRVGWKKSGPVQSRAGVARWEESGVTRLIVSPWNRSPEAVDALERFAILAL